MEWFRWWHGSVTDPKFQLIARRAKTTTANVIAVWASVLEHASSVTQCDASDASVTRGNVTKFQCDVYDVLLGFEDGICAEIFKQFCLHGLIENNFIVSWEHRQPKREDNSAARTRAYRDRKKSVTQCDASDASVTQCNAPDTDTELKDSVCVTRAENDFFENEKTGDALTPGFVCGKLTERGIAKTNPSNPKLLAVLKQGATLADFMYAVDLSLNKKDPFAYAIGVVEGILLEKQTKKSRNPPGKVNGYDPLSNNGENYGTKRQNYEANTYAGRKPTAQETQQAARRAWEAKQQRERGDNATPIN